MSRQKNFTAKLVADAPPDEKLAAAIYGDNRNAEAIKLFKLWCELGVITLHSGEMRRIGEKEYQRRITDEIRQRRRACFDSIADHIDESIKTGDASFFRAFADTIEGNHLPADPLRTVVGGLAHVIVFLKGAASAWTKELQAQWTLANIHRIVEERLGRTVDKDQFRRICKEMGLPLTKGTIGRPKGSKDTHRALKKTDN